MFECSLHPLPPPNTRLIIHALGMNANVSGTIQHLFNNLRQSKLFFSHSADYEMNKS